MKLRLQPKIAFLKHFFNRFMKTPTRPIGLSSSKNWYNFLLLTIQAPKSKIFINLLFFPFLGECTMEP